MSLKPFLAAAVLGLSATLAACGNGGGGEEDVPTLRRGISAKVGVLDPHRSSAAWENVVIGDMIVGLMQTGPNGEVIPGVATSWETDPAGLVWTFTLREDAVWSDGTALTANDFVYALRRIQAPATDSQYSSLLFIIKNAEEVKNGELPGEELGARAIDDYTLEITLKEPAPYLLELLTHYTTYPVPEHVVEAYGDDWTDVENIVVNGPYVLKFWQTGNQIVADKNPLFWDADEVCFERVVYLELEDPTAVERRIEPAELDINNDYDGGREAELKARFPGWPRTSPGLLTTYYSFNSTIEPFNDVRVRTALAMALDREFMVENVLSPGYIPAYSFVPPRMANYETERPEVDWKSLDRTERLDQARTLLQEAGFGPDNPLEFEFIFRSTGDNPKVAPVAQANWNELGDWVNAQILRQDTQVLYSRLQETDFEMADGGWIADYNDPLNFLYLLDSRTGQQNYGNYNNSEYDALLRQASNERDLVRRAEIFAQAEALMLSETPITPMWFAVNKNMVDPNITGWGENAKDIHRSRWMCRADLEVTAEEAAE